MGNKYISYCQLVVSAMEKNTARKSSISRFLSTKEENGETILCIKRQGNLPFVVQAPTGQRA